MAPRLAAFGNEGRDRVGIPIGPTLMHRNTRKGGGRIHELTGFGCAGARLLLDLPSSKGISASGSSCKLEVDKATILTR